MKACVDALPDCEPLVLEHCLRTYSLPHDDSDTKSQDGLVSTEVTKGSRGRGGGVIVRWIETGWRIGPSLAQGSFIRTFVFYCLAFAAVWGDGLASLHVDDVVKATYVWTYCAQCSLLPSPPNVP